MPCLCTAWLSAAWLGAALLLACCGSAMAQQAEEEGFARSLDRPVSLPDPLQNPVDLRRGIQFGAGIHNVRVKSEALAVEFERKDSFSDGGSLHVDWLLDAIRLSYLRQIFRPELQQNLTFEGQTITRVAFDSDQLWAFHGIRPWFPLYLGYGLGFQRREVTLTQSGGAKIEFSETLGMAGLMLDYAVAPPLSLQVRFFWEEDGGFFQQSGQMIFLSYVASL